MKVCFSFMRQSEALTCREHLAHVAQLSSVLVIHREVIIPMWKLLSVELLCRIRFLPLLSWLFNRMSPFPV